MNSRKKERAEGVIVQASDTALMASLADGKKREPHQIVTILLDAISSKEFAKLALSKRVELLATE